MKIKGQDYSFIRELKGFLPKVNQQRLKFIELILKALWNCLGLNRITSNCSVRWI
jgi:hypothetical protein